MVQNRREFLGSLAVAAPSAPKIKVGLIGCGWYGMVDVKAAFKVGGVEFVALCDVDSEHLAPRPPKWRSSRARRPKTFKLYGDLLDTPGLGRGDHRHAAALARPAVHRRRWSKGSTSTARSRWPTTSARAGRWSTRPSRARAHRADRLPAPPEQGLPRRPSELHPRGQGRHGSCRSTPRSTTTPAPKDPTPQDPPAVARLGPLVRPRRRRFPTARRSAT